MCAGSITLRTSSASSSSLASSSSSDDFEIGSNYSTPLRCQRSLQGHAHRPQDAEPVSHRDAFDIALRRSILTLATNMPRAWAADVPNNAVDLLCLLACGGHKEPQCAAGARLGPATVFVGVGGLGPVSHARLKRSVLRALQLTLQREDPPRRTAAAVCCVRNHT